MDTKPFFEFDVRNYTDAHLAELKKFQKNAFDLDKILNSANDLKYAGAIRKLLEEEFNEPSEDFIKLLASKVYDGRMTKSVLEQFEQIVKKSTAEFITEKVSKKLQSALDNTTVSNRDVDSEDEDDVEDNGIETTEEELKGFYIVQAIAAEIIDVERVVHRDTRSYFGILLDNNNRKPICRLHFNRSQKYISLFSDMRQEEKHALNSVEDIYKHAVHIKAVIQHYDGGKRISAA